MDLKILSENLPEITGVQIFLSPVQALVLFLLFYSVNGLKKR